jgi:hypothetical protein
MMLTVSGMSKKYRISQTTIRDAIRAGRIKAEKDSTFAVNQSGYRLLISEEEASRYSKTKFKRGRPRTQK